MSNIQNLGNFPHTIGNLDDRPNLTAEQMKEKFEQDVMTLWAKLAECIPSINDILPASRLVDIVNNSSTDSGVPTAKAVYEAIADASLGGNAQQIIEDWLDAHPEATTTVQDGSITNAKLSTSFASPGVAPEYVSNTLYPAGSYVFHGGILYTNPDDVNDAVWTLGHWTTATLGNELSVSANKYVDSLVGKNATVKFNVLGYYTAANTIGSSSTFTCTEIVIPANLKEISATFVHALGPQYIVMMLLDSSKTLIAAMNGGDEGSTRKYVLSDYPDARYIQVNFFGSYYYQQVDLKYEPFNSLVVEENVFDGIAKDGTVISDYWCAANGDITYSVGTAYIKVPIAEGIKHISVTYPMKWDDIEEVGNLYTGRAVFLNSSSVTLESMRPQDYIAPSKCGDLYYCTYPVPENAKYFCVTVKLSNWDETDTIVIVKGKTIHYIDTSVLSADGFTLADVDLRRRLAYADTSDWSNMTWLMVGDSLTQVNTRANYHYYDYISADTGVNTINKGASGLGYKRGPHWFYDALSEVNVDDFDFCTFFGSGNDMYYVSGADVIKYTDSEFPAVLGNVTDSTFDTICGCINKTFDRFVELYPLKKFGVITPTPWADQTAAGGIIANTNMDKYVEKLISICKRRGIPYLDLYHSSGLRPWNADFRVEYYKENGVQDDGTHPNSKGHKWFYPMIKQFIKQCLVQ